MLIKRLAQWVNDKKMTDFIQSEDGASTTIEAVLWLPLYLFLLMACIDATVMMKAQTDLWAVASNTARMVSTNMMTEAEAEEYGQGLLQNSVSYVVDVQTDGVNVTASVSRPTSSIPRFGYLAFGSPNVIASTTQRIEPAI